MNYLYDQEPEANQLAPYSGSSTNYYLCRVTTGEGEANWAEDERISSLPCDGRGGSFERCLFGGFWNWPTYKALIEVPKSSPPSLFSSFKLCRSSFGIFWPLVSPAAGSSSKTTSVFFFRHLTMMTNLNPSYQLRQ